MTGRWGKILILWRIFELVSVSVSLKNQWFSPRESVGNESCTLLNWPVTVTSQRVFPGIQLSSCYLWCGPVLLALSATLGSVCALADVELKLVIVQRRWWKVVQCLPTSVDKALLFPLEGSDHSDTETDSYAEGRRQVRSLSLRKFYIFIKRRGTTE